MRVGFVSWRDLANPNAGGSEVVVDRLVTGLRDRGHDAMLLCGGPVGERPYDTVDIGSVYSQYLKAPFACRRHGPFDLVVDVANGMSFFAPLWRRGPALLLVTHVQGEMWHQYYFSRPVARVGELLEGTVAPVVYRRTPVVAISESTRDALRSIGYGRDQIRVVPLGVAEEYFERLAPKSAEPLFLALGRLAPHKAFDRLIDLWARVQPITGGRLVIAGDGPERTKLESRRAPGVELVGFVSEERKRELLGSAWLLVHTAHQEGWGLVVMEAAACGTPALAYDVPGIRDSIVDGVTGARAADDERFVAEWIRLAGDVECRERLGDAARRRARGFSWDHTLDAFLAVAAEAGAVDAGDGARNRDPVPAVVSAAEPAPSSAVAPR
jgi:glycosyltransferase involved in cell wall biosynthesis